MELEAMRNEWKVGSQYNDPNEREDEFTPTPLSEILAEMNEPEPDHWQWYQSVPQLLGHEEPNLGPTQDWEFQLVDLQARGLLDKPAYKNLTDEIVVTAQKAVTGDANMSAQNNAHANRHQRNLAAQTRKLEAQSPPATNPAGNPAGNNVPVPHPKPLTANNAPVPHSKPEAAPNAPVPHPKPQKSHVQRRREQREGLSTPQPSDAAQSTLANNYQTPQERKDARHGNNGPVARPEGKTLTPEEKRDARHGPNRDLSNSQRHEADEIIDEIVGFGSNALGATGKAMEQLDRKDLRTRREANRSKAMKIAAQRMANNPQSTGVKATGRKAAQAMKEANRLLAGATGPAGATQSPQKAAGFFDNAARLANMSDGDLQKMVDRGSRMAKAATILSLGYAAVKVATAEDKADEALKQGAPLAGSFLATAAVTALGLAAAPTLGGIAVAAGVLLAAGYAGSYVGDLVYEAISGKDDEPDYQPNQ